MLIEHTVEDGKNYKVQYYNLYMIISAGYRVNSKRGIIFRKNCLKGADAKEILEVIGEYSKALDLLDDYDHITLNKTNRKIQLYRL